MEIVFLEKGSLGNDLDLSYFSELGHVTLRTDKAGGGSGADQGCGCDHRQQDSDE